MKLYSIKPLEWNKTDNGYYQASGTFDIDYSIRKSLSGSLYLCLESPTGKDTHIACTTLDEAKSKAQEDWNNRISQYLTEYKEGE